MDSTQEFETTIIKYFKEIISDFNLEWKYGPSGKHDEIQLYNEKCMVRFIYDKGLVLCDFISPEEKLRRESVIRKDGFPSGFPVYSAYSVWKFLYPHDKINYNYIGWDIDEQVLAYKNILLERLTNVLRGDFSWAGDYKTNDNRISKKLEYMMTHWESDHPIRIKFKEGNSDWERDFDNLIKP